MQDQRVRKKSDGILSKMRIRISVFEEKHPVEEILGSQDEESKENSPSDKNSPALHPTIILTLPDNCKAQSSSSLENLSTTSEEEDVILIEEKAEEEIAALPTEITPKQKRKRLRKKGLLNLKKKEKHPVEEILGSQDEESKENSPSDKNSPALHPTIILTLPDNCKAQSSSSLENLSTTSEEEDVILIEEKAEEEIAALPTEITPKQKRKKLRKKGLQNLKKKEKHPVEEILGSQDEESKENLPSSDKNSSDKNSPASLHPTNLLTLPDNCKAQSSSSLENLSTTSEEEDVILIEKEAEEEIVAVPSEITRKRKRKKLRKRIFRRLKKKKTPEVKNEVNVKDLLEEVDLLKEKQKEQILTLGEQQEKLKVCLLDKSEELIERTQIFKKVSRETKLKHKSKVRFCGLFASFRCCWYVGSGKPPRRKRKQNKSK